RAIRHLDVAYRGKDILDELVALLQHDAGAEDGAIVLHHLLHSQPQLSRRGLAGRMPELVEAREGKIGGIARWIRVGRFRPDDLGASRHSPPAEPHKVDE